MAHWEHRPEENWKKFAFEQPYAKGLARLREVIESTDYDPAVLWQWGTMQAMALIGILEECEAEFGAKGQEVVYRSLRRTGFDVGRQILDGASWPEDLTEAEFCSFYATVINRIAYASLEEPSIDSEDQISFHIVWCPHQDHYKPFDCRVQRYFVQGMIDAAQEFAERFDFQVRFDSTIPAGAETCHFTIWRASDLEKSQWESYTELLERKALERSKKRRAAREQEGDE